MVYALTQRTCYSGCPVLAACPKGGGIYQAIIVASSLESLLAEGVISEIYGRLKSGKEAEVYAVAYGDDVVAAKVYKDRAQRSFKSNSAYKEGRSVRNTRSQRAMDRGSKFGQEAAEEAWKAEEANALYKLHAINGRCGGLSDFGRGLRQGCGLYQPENAQ